jgi:hypothetical protein
VFASLTLGLAPFFPEPHLFGKLKWIAGGAVGMEAMDWFDALMHGFPWLMLLRAISLEARDGLRAQKEKLQ